MTFDLQFVDSISGTATVRLNLNDDVTWRALADGTNFGVPSLSRAVSSTLLNDGDFVSAAAYGNRVLTLTLEYKGTDFDAAAGAVQALMREVDRPANFLRYRPGTTSPVFFRTLRSEVSGVHWDAVSQTATVSLLAEPFALGLKETVGTVTVFNDPATPGPDLNSNPYFETNAAGWTAVGGTVARSTAQFHEGVASLLLTPDGVTANVEARTDLIPVQQGAQYRVSAWVRSTAARAVNVNVNWYTSGGVFVSASQIARSLPALTWTFYEDEFTPPATATQARLLAGAMGGTPPASNTVLIDEARLRLEAAGNGMYADLTGVKGDVETPLRITVPQSAGLVAADQMSVLAVRRRGTPSQVPFLLQAEAMTQGTDTTTQSAADDTSGTGNEWSRTTFATAPTSSVSRLSVSTWPTTSVPDVRGRYRVFARVRTTVSSDVIYATLRWGLTLVTAGNQEVSVGWNGSAGYTGWKLVDLGLIQFPSGSDPGVDGLSGVPLSVRGQQIAVEARRTVGGSGNLDWDYLAFVPADDRLQVIDWNDIELSGGSVVIDGTSEMVYPVDSSGVVYGGGQPPGVAGGFMAATPGVTNRLYWLRSAGPLGADVVGGQSTALTIDYWPRYVFTRPVSS